MRRAEHVGIGRVRLLHAHLVVETMRNQVLAHLLAAAKLVDEGLIQPGLVNAQRRVGEQPVTVEAFDVVTLVGRTVTPDIDAVFLHRHHQRSAGHGAAKRRRIEIGGAARLDMKCAALDGGDTLGGELRPAIDQAGDLSAVLLGLARDVVVIALIGLTEMRGIRAGNGPLAAHPMHGGGRIQTTGEGDADALADGNILQDGRSHSRFSTRSQVFQGCVL